MLTKLDNVVRAHGKGSKLSVHEPAVVGVSPQNKVIDTQLEYNIVCEHVWLMEIMLVPCSTVHQIADILSKPLGQVNFKTGVEALVHSDEALE